MTQHVEYTFHRGIPVPVYAGGDPRPTPIYDQLVLEQAAADPVGIQLVEAIHARKRQQAAQDFRLLPWLKGKP